MFDYRRVIQGIQARVRCMGDWAIAAQDVLEAPLCIFATLPEPIATYDRPQVSILSHTCWSSQQVITMRVIHVRCSTNKAVIRLPSMLTTGQVQPCWDLFLVLKQQLVGSCWLLVRLVRLARCQHHFVGVLGILPAAIALQGRAVEPFGKCFAHLGPRNLADL